MSQTESRESDPWLSPHIKRRLRWRGDKCHLWGVEGGGMIADDCGSYSVSSAQSILLFHITLLCCVKLWDWNMASERAPCSCSEGWLQIPMIPNTRSFSFHKVFFCIIFLGYDWLFLTQVTRHGSQRGRSVGESDGAYSSWHWSFIVFMFMYKDTPTSHILCSIWFLHRCQSRLGNWANSTSYVHYVHLPQVPTISAASFQVFLFFLCNVSMYI